MKGGLIIGIIILVVIVLLGFSFLKAPSQEEFTEEVPISIEEETGIGESIPEELEEIPSPVVKEFTITASNFKFEPSNLAVNQGDIVKITLINEGGTHNIFFEEYNERTNVESAPVTQTLEFVADQLGSFAFWCEVSTHRALGMEGTLVVG
jgi:cytochrome c oxidase subunit 2